MKVKNVSKSRVEEMLGSKITNQQFADALASAERKQAYIYQTTGNPVALQEWYLEKLTQEYVLSLELTRVTMEACFES